MLLCHRFFWPDTAPYASMLRTIGTHFAAAGHEVDILSAQPSYNAAAGGRPRQPARQTLDGLQILRVPLLRERKKDLLIRSVNAIVFSLRVFFHVLFSRRYDVVMTSTFPPILLALLACLASRLRGAHFVYHCMDLHPEISHLSGGLGEGWWFRLLRGLDQWTCRNASAVVVLSSDMQQTLVSRAPSSPPRIAVINNFSLPVFDEATPPDDEAVQRVLEPAADACRFVFAGNLGRFQDLEVVTEAAARLRDRSDFELVFVGEGLVKARLQARVRELGLTNVHFVDFQPTSVAMRIVAAADFGLVTLAPGIERGAYPSKTLTYLTAGCPLFVLVDSNSELARTVAGEALGIVVGERSPQAIAEAFARACDERARWRDRREQIAAWADTRHSVGAVLAQWDTLMETLA
jgi:glycosyltransferase involved in cell wall biosynthesis